MLVMSELYGIGDIEVWNGRELEEVLNYDDVKELLEERAILKQIIKRLEGVVGE